jgi:DNA-binding CsgD family transcriptional regulator
MAKAMDKGRLDRLTEQQRACLRMVYLHMTSKEIAPRLGIEPGSVDQHIKAAMRTLGVGERRAAARMLAEYEGAREREAAAPEELAVHEDQDGFEASPPSPSQGFRLPLPLWGGRPSDLSPLQRLAWILAIMLMIALSFGVFLAGLEALSRIGRAVHS